MKALVTGGSGFIGGHIVQELERRGHEVTILSLSPPRYYTKADFIQLDIKRIGVSRHTSLSNYDVVFHAAAELGTHTTYSRIYDTFATNVLGMISLLDWLKDSDTKVLNCGVVREWNNPYIASKQAAAKIGYMYRKEFGTKFLDIKMTIVYGPRQGWKEEKIVPRFILKTLRGEQLPIFGDGSSMMNMMYVKDVANIYAELAEKDEAFCEVDRIELANPNGDISVGDFAELVIESCRWGVNPEDHCPKCQNAFNAGVHHVGMRSGQPGNVGVEYNLDAAHKYIGSLDGRFTPLKEGLRQTIDWYKGVV